MSSKKRAMFRINRWHKNGSIYRPSRVKMRTRNTWNRCRFQTIKKYLGWEHWVDIACKPALCMVFPGFVVGRVSKESACRLEKTLHQNLPCEITCSSHFWYNMMVNLKDCFLYIGFNLIHKDEEVIIIVYIREFHTFWNSKKLQVLY